MNNDDAVSKYDWPETCACGARFDDGIGAIFVKGVEPLIGFAIAPGSMSAAARPTPFIHERLPVQWESYGECSECGTIIHLVQSG